MSAGGFAAYRDDERPPGNWLVALLGSSTVYVALAIAAVMLGTVTRKIVKEKSVDVTFVEKVVKEAPPPPPAPPKPEPVVQAKPQAPAAAAPVVRPEQKIRKLDKPPPPKQLTAPKEMPKEAPREADPSQDKGVAVYGEAGKGDPAGLEGGVAKGGVVGGEVGGAIALPEEATPPAPDASNAKPVYPQEARVAGKTGTVILKV